MLKDRDFCGKPPQICAKGRGSIGQVAEVWSKIRISMEGAFKGAVLRCQGDKQQSGSGQGNGSSVKISEVINNGWLSR